MAQKQIALQQVRSGKQRDLPDALEKGQIGFSTDVGRLFIGLPSASEPASLVAGRNWSNAPNSGKENVEIITEFTPWEIINDIVNKPNLLQLPANQTTVTTLRTTSRVFLEYVGYNTTGLLETGAVQLVAVDNTNVLISQQNNTNKTDGIVAIDFGQPSYDTGTKRLSISITNRSSSAITLEFIIRGWDKQ
jgi:hypothetical protein